MKKKLFQLQDFFWIFFLPLSWIAILVSHWVISRRIQRTFKVPVISVGNLNLGGTGKTPLVVAIANHFSAYPVAVVSRGYRGKLSSSGAKVDLSHPEGSDWYGDEPWLIAKKTSADVFVGANRIKNFDGYQIDSKYKVAILDDGFQHTQVGRNVDVVLLPAGESPWNSQGVPLGELRENFTKVSRATHVLVESSTGSEEHLENQIATISILNPSAQIFRFQRFINDPIQQSGQKIPSDQICWGAFCGIAHPERFEKDISEKVPVSFFKTYPDHYPYSRRCIEHLIRSAEEKGVNALVTTEKDFVKVSGLFSSVSFPLYIVSQQYEIPREFWDSLDNAVSGAC